MDMNSRDLITAREVSIKLGIHVQTAYNWAKSGRIPSINVCGRRRFSLKKIEEIIKQGETQVINPETLIPKARISLEECDKLFLKGGRSALRNKSRRWNYGFGSIYVIRTKRGIDRWYREYRENGNRIREVVPQAQSRGEAFLALQAKVAGIFNGVYRPGQTTGKLEFGAFADRYMNEYAKSSKTSWRTDEYKLRPIRDYFKGINASDITEAMVREFRGTRLQAGRSESTTNRYLALLRKMFNWAIANGLLASNPVKGIKMFSEIDRVRDRVLRQGEEERLFVELVPRLRLFILTLLHTGLRYREGLNLTWENVDLIRKRIKVERTKSKRARIIPINSLLLKTLEGLSSGSSGPKVFPFKSARTGFENACKRAGLADFTFHDLRRTFGTRLLEHGVDIVTISKLYGHSSVLVTQRYLHPSEELSIEAVEFLASSPLKQPETSPCLARARHTAKKPQPSPSVNLN